MNEVKIGGIYRHFKGKEKLYRVINLARGCENSSKIFVIYEQLYETKDSPKGTIWKRSLKEFVGFKEIDGRKVKRFELTA